MYVDHGTENDASVRKIFNRLTWFMDIAENAFRGLARKSGKFDFDNKIINDDNSLTFLHCTNSCFNKAKVASFRFHSLGHTVTLRRQGQVIFELVNSWTK